MGDGGVDLETAGAYDGFLAARNCRHCADDADGCVVVVDGERE